VPPALTCSTSKTPAGNVIIRHTVRDEASLALSGVVTGHAALSRRRCSAPRFLRYACLSKQRADTRFPDLRLSDDASHWIVRVPFARLLPPIMRRFRVDSRSSRNTSRNAWCGIPALRATVGNRSFARQGWGVADAAAETRKATLTVWTPSPRLCASRECMTVDDAEGVS
jgi:hypothetical protein